MAVTVLDVLRRVRNILEGGRPNRINMVNGASVTTGQTVISLILGEGQLPLRGQMVELDGEGMWVTAVSTTPTPAMTVVRGLDGNVAHQVTGDLAVRLAPAVVTPRILQAMRAEMGEWPYNLRQIHSKELSALDGTQSRRASLSTLFGANLAADFDYPIGVSRLLGDSDAGEAWVTRWHYAARPAATGTDLTAADPYLSFLTSQDLGDSTLRLYYAAPIRHDLFPTGTSATALAAVDLDALNVSERWADLWAYGAAARLFPELESRRMELEPVGQSRHSQDVPPTSYLRLAQAYRQMADSNIAAEVYRILGQFGIRST